MLSWRLWQALRYPPEDDPLYQHALESHVHTVTVPVHKPKRGNEPSDEFPFERARTKRIFVTQPANSSRNKVLKVLAALGLTLFCCCGSSGFFLLPVALVLVGMGTLYGLLIAVRISGQIAEERDQGRYELLSLTPSGAWGFGWATIMSYLYRSATFSRLRRWVPIVSVLLALVAASGLLFQVFIYVRTPTYQQEFTNDWWELVFLFYVGTTVAALYIDFYQSVIAGVLLAMVIPTYGRNRFETQALTVGAFLGVQIATYLTTLLVGFLILPGIYYSLGIYGWVEEIVMIALRLGVFVLVREIIIMGLWQFAQQRLNIGEIDLLSKAKREVPIG